ncbi:MAG: peptidylprolyl isomerase [Acidobacteriota bacterium]
MELLPIADRSVVALHFTLFNQGGETLDTTIGNDPIVYLHGFGQFIPGLETALQGRRAGDKFVVTVSPEEGFGTREGEGPKPYPRDAFPPDLELEPGMEFTVGDDDDGDPLIVWVTEVTADEVFVDINHPLAGETLTFDVEVLSVRPATRQELEHGHAHGHHGHNH